MIKVNISMNSDANDFMPNNFGNRKTNYSSREIKRKITKKNISIYISKVKWLFNDKSGMSHK